MRIGAYTPCMSGTWPSDASLAAAQLSATAPTVPANTVVRFPQGTDNRAAAAPTQWPNAASITAALRRAGGQQGV